VETERAGTIQTPSKRYPVVPKMHARFSWRVSAEGTSWNLRHWFARAIRLAKSGLPQDVVTDRSRYGRDEGGH